MSSNKIQKSIGWSLFSEIAVKFVVPITNMILARVLTPDAFGVVAVCNMLISLSLIHIYTQAYYRNNISQEDKLALDAKYAQKVTFLGDLKIFFKTIETVVCRKNVYTN